MTTVAYIANEFPSPVERYVMDEVDELRRRDVEVICCSGKRVSPERLNLSERAFWKETKYFQPLTDEQILQATKRLVRDRRKLAPLWRTLLRERGVSAILRARACGHTVMGAALARELEPFEVEHIHAHHGYFASWMALTAARLLGIGFSFTLHGSDLLQRGDLMLAKLRECTFCVTVSNYNREFILRKYPTVTAGKILVQRLGVDQVIPWPTVRAKADDRSFHLLAVGRLHAVKNYEFLTEACARLRKDGLRLMCWIAGEGPERRTLEKKIASLHLERQVLLLGHVSRATLESYYRSADLVVMTSRSEGVPVALMEAMAHEKLVLAPAITGIPELVENGRTGFLYEPGSLTDFTSAVKWICANGGLLDGLRRAAAAKVAKFYNRQLNLHSFADNFLARISRGEREDADSVLQQVQLSV